MKTILVASIACLLMASCNHIENSDISEVMIVGTRHEPSNYFNSDSLLSFLRQTQPEVILVELESQHFTKDYKFNLKDFPDLLSTNENIAISQYDRESKVQLRPFDIEGRNEYYRRNHYFDKFNHIFTVIDSLHSTNLLSERSSKEWEIMKTSVDVYDPLIANSTLKEFNEETTLAYSHAKDDILYKTLISITRRELPELLSDAQLLLNFWNKRNKEMAKKIKQYSIEFKGKKIAVIMGQDHVYDIKNLLETEYNTQIAPFGLSFDNSRE